MGYLSNLLRSYYEEDKPQSPPLPTDTTQSQSQSQPQPRSRPPIPHIPTPSQSDSRSTTSTALTTLPPTLDTSNLYQNPRARTIKQLSVFLSGAALLATTTLITKRAITRKLRLHTPKFYIPSNHRPTDANGAVEAAEAFALATVNVGALGLMLTGGAMFALDVVSAEDLRDKYRRKRGYVDNVEESADEEIEEWVKGVLEKKEGGDYKGVAEGLTALVGVLAGKEEDREKLAQMVKEDKEKEAEKEKEDSRTREG